MRCACGLASVLDVMADGKSVEVGLTGKEGFVGLPLIVGFASSASRVSVQIEGAAFRLSASAPLRKCRTLETRLHRYSQDLARPVRSGGGMQPATRSGRTTGSMATDKPGPDRVGCSSADSGIPRAHAEHRAIQHDGGCFHPAKGRAHSKIHARPIEHSESKRLEEVACECYRALVQQALRWQERRPAEPAHDPGDARGSASRKRAFPEKRFGRQTPLPRRVK